MQIAIVLYPGVTALDFIGPYEVFRFLPDVEIRFLWHEPGPIVTDSNFLVVGATHSFDETLSPDIILLPGSEANTTTAMADQRLVKWLKNAHMYSTYTLSVCSGALVLAAANLLGGRSATTHWFAQENLRRFGVIPEPNKRIVQSGKIVTAAGVSAGIDLALLIVQQLYGKSQAEKIQLLIEYDPKPPVDSGHPSKANSAIYKKAHTEMSDRIRNPRNLISVPVILWRQILNKLRKDKSH